MELAANSYQRNTVVPTLHATSDASDGRKESTYAHPGRGRGPLTVGPLDPAHGCF